MIGGRLARESFEPDLVMTDGYAMFAANAVPVGVADAERGGRGVEPVPADVQRAVERQAPRDDGRPARSTASATRTSPASATGTSPRPSCSASGARRATPSTTRPRTGSPTTRPRCSSTQVDVVCGRRLRPGRRARAGGVAVPRDPPGGDQPGRPRLRHPRPPHAAALGAPGRHGRRGRGGHRLRAGHRRRRRREPRCPPTTSCASSARSSTPTTPARPRCAADRAHEPTPRCTPGCASCSASSYPIVQTGMGWVAGARLTSATSAAGGLGILASATMTYDELRRGHRRGQGPHRQAVRRQPAGRPARHRRPPRPAHPRGRAGGLVRPGPQPRRHRQAQATPAW